MPIKKIYRSFAEAARLLGVEVSAPRDEIEKKFRQLSRQFHPDLNTDNPDAKRRFNALNLAHETLISGREEKRLIASFETDTLDDIFENMINRYDKAVQKEIRETLEQLEKEDLNEL